MAREALHIERARRREHTRHLTKNQQIYVYCTALCLFVVCCSYIVWGDSATQGWPKSVGRSLPAWVFSEWLWALVMGLHAVVLLGVLVGPPVLVHPVARRKFTWKVGVWWGAGFLCEAAALAAGAMAAGSTAHLRLSATMLAAAACSFHVPVLGPNFKSLYRNYMVTWVALDAATQTLDRGTARTPAPHRRFNSSPNIPAAAEDASGQDALVNMGSSSSRPANVAFARNLGVVSPPAWGRSSSAAQREHAMAFFRVHLQLGLVAVATSVHAALLLAPAANVLLAASTATTSTSQKPDDETTLGVLLLGLVVAAWAVAVCVRWNVVYGVSACCVLLSLPVGHGLLSMLDADARGHPRGAFQPLWDDLSTSPALLSAFASIAVAALAAVAIAHYCVQQVCALLTQQGGERYGWGTLGSSGYWGSEALLEPLEGPGASAQGLQGAHAHRSFNSLEMSALLHHDDSGLDPP